MSPGISDRPGARERDRFQRRRARAATEAGLLLAGVGILAALLLAPGDLGEIRLGGLALAWWLALAVMGGAGLTLVGRGAAVVSPGLAGGLAAAAAWLSAPLAVEIAVQVLADGTLGLWLPVTVAIGAWLALGSAGPGLAGRSEDPAGAAPVASPASVAARRWRLAGGWRLAPLALTDGLVSVTWLWAQLAAVREVAVGMGMGLPGPVAPAALGAIVLAALVRERIGRAAGLVAAAAGLGALGLSLAAVMATTSPAWPGVWAAVADRAEVTFPAGSPWTVEGRPLPPAAAGAGIALPDDQRIVLAGRGVARLRPWEGGDLPRDVDGELPLVVRRGDRLAVPGGMTARFEAGRRVPGAPATGADWVHPPGPRPGAADLVGLGLTVLAGAVGLAPALGALGGTRPGRGRLGRLVAGGGVTAGCLAATLWALYAAWLGPEVYLTGASGPAVFDTAGRAATLGLAGPPVRLAALGGVVALGVAAALAALRAFAATAAMVTGDGRLPALGGLALAAGLAAVLPVPPWPVALAALGVAAAAGAPVLLLSLWSIRATARGVAAGAAVGLATYGLLAGLAAWRGLDPAGGARIAEGWGAWVTAWPALAALPAALAVAWLLRARRGAVDRGRLPSGLGELHG